MRETAALQCQPGAEAGIHCAAWGRQCGSGHRASGRHGMLGARIRSDDTRDNVERTGHLQRAPLRQSQFAVGVQFQPLQARHGSADGIGATVTQQQLRRDQPQRACRCSGSRPGACRRIAQHEPSGLQLRRLAGTDEAAQAAGLQIQTGQAGTADANRAVQIERAVAAQGERAKTAQTGQTGVVQQQPGGGDRYLAQAHGAG